MNGATDPSPAARLWAGLARSSLRRPGAWVAASLALLAAAAPFAASLYGNLHTDLRELLPQGAKAAVALGQLEQRVGGLGHLSVVVETEDLAAGERFMDALGAALGPLVPGTIRNLRWKVDAERHFIDAHGALFASVEELTRMRDGLREQVSAATKKANPLVVDLDDDDEAAAKPAAQGPVTLSAEQAAALRKLQGVAGQYDHFLDGYLAGEGGKTLCMIVTPNDVALGLDSNQKLFAAVDAVVKKLDPKSFHRSLRVGYDGDVREVIEAQEHLIGDIGLSAVLVLLAVGGVILLFYRTLVALPLVVMPLFTGAALSFAASKAAIGFLNPNTAFLGSIIIGNGINAGLILLARYLEERRRGATAEEALPLALSSTWLATLGAAGAAAASYGSLAATAFRGFSQFAFMGGTGMLLCWISTYLFMPGWIGLIERWRPLGQGGRAHGGPSRVLARLLASHARAVLAVSLLVSVGAAAMLVRFSRDPIEYDFTKLGSRQGAIDGAQYYSAHLDAVMQSYQTPTVILTDSPESAERVAKAVDREKAREGAASSIDQVRTLGRLMPESQQPKLALVSEILGLIDDRVLAALPDDLRPLVRRFKERTVLREVRVADLPAQFTWVFEEKVEGSAPPRRAATGRLVLVYPTLQTNSAHGDRQLAFVRGLRQTAEAADPSAQVAGGLILSADIVETITADGTFTALLSFGAVVLLTLLLMRDLRHAGWVIGALLLGTLWMGGALGLLHLKLNFVNFVVLPITFGIGVDYALNLYQRYRQDGEVAGALASSGGAVALCSATTIIGYATLIIADNRAIFSFGLAAVLGEATSLAAALVVLPAALQLFGRHRRAVAAKALGAGA
jgi:hypothetical protein